MQRKVFAIVGLVVIIIAVVLAIVLLLPHGSSSSYSTTTSSTQAKIAQVGNVKVYYYYPEHYQFGIELNSSSAVKVISAYVEINGHKLENDSVNIMLSPGTNFLVIYIPSNSNVLNGLSKIPITLCLNNGQQGTFYGVLCGCYNCARVGEVGTGYITELSNGTWELHAKIESNINVNLIGIVFSGEEIPANIQIRPGLNNITVTMGNLTFMPGATYTLSLVLNDGETVTITAVAE